MAKANAVAPALPSSDAPLFELDSLSVTFGQTRALNNLSGTIPAHQHVGLIGPNGCGKTTLMRVLFGAVRPEDGSVTFAGERLDGLQPYDIAKRIALVPQAQFAPQRVRVIDEVLLGRIPFLSNFASYSTIDYTMATQALELVGLAGIANHYSDELSGGERQRTTIARALTQGTECLLLDEPTNHLDIFFQHKVLSLLHSLVPHVVTVLHDINLAAQYCDWILMLHNGTIFAAGRPDDVLTAENIEHIYGVRASTYQHEGKTQYCFSINPERTMP